MSVQTRGWMSCERSESLLRGKDVDPGVGCGVCGEELSAYAVIDFFFFSSRRRHTRLQGDWSSDVCSSDLVLGLHGAGSVRPDGARPPRHHGPGAPHRAGLQHGRGGRPAGVAELGRDPPRSGERRVGEEGRTPGSPDHLKKKKKKKTME